MSEKIQIDETKYEGRTPGKWSAHQHNGNSEWYADIESDKGNQTIQTVAMVLKYAPLSEQAANARLIADAPLILSALLESRESAKKHCAAMNEWRKEYQELDIKYRLSTTDLVLKLESDLHNERMSLLESRKENERLREAVAKFIKWDDAESELLPEPPHKSTTFNERMELYSEAINAARQALSK